MDSQIFWIDKARRHGAGGARAAREALARAAAGARGLTRDAATVAVQLDRRVVFRSGSSRAARARIVAVAESIQYRVCAAAARPAEQAACNGTPTGDERERGELRSRKERELRN